MNVDIGVRSDVGRLRTGNEDSYLVEEPLFVVADGMGGHTAGDVASSTAVETIVDHLDSASAEDPDSLAGLLREANAAIWSKSQSDASLSGMGTTCTLVYLDDDRAHVAHVGDSRAYRLRAEELEQLTEDHTLVARMVKEGKLEAGDAERHPQRNVITRALGIDADVRVDLATIELSDGDRLLLCSDGLTSMIGEHDIKEVLLAEGDPQAAADLLVDLANEAGGEDNVTVVLIDVRDAHGPAGSPSRLDRAEPPPPPARVRTPTTPDGSTTGAAPRRWLRRLVPVLVVLALLAAGLFGVRYTLDNSWYVGVDENDRVAIFTGIPEKIAGFELNEKHEVTSTTLDDLPEFLRPNVLEGIRVDSLDEAHAKIADLNDRAREFGPEATRRRSES